MTKKLLLAGVLVLSTAFLAVAACQQGGTVTSSTEVKDSALPKGWVKAEVTGEKMSIGCPPGWHAIDMTANDFDKTMDSVQLDATTRSQIKELAANKAFKLIVMHKIEVDFSPNLTIIETPSPSRVTLDQLRDANIEELKSTATGSPVVSKTTVDGVDAYLIKWQQPKPMGSSKDILNEWSYLLLKDNNQYMLTFTTVPSDGLDKEVAGMFNTFHLG